MEEALEMRGQHQVHHQQRQGEGQQHRAAGLLELARLALPVDLGVVGQLVAGHAFEEFQRLAHAVAGGEACADGDRAQAVEAVEARSEEHTSELQSLMRISYAVLCLKKKNNIK